MEKNVVDFIEQASAAVGRFESDCFSQTCSFDHPEDITSPIERILYSALMALMKVNGIDEATDPIKDGDDWHVPGVMIRPQFEIGKYRADFLLCHEVMAYSTQEWVSKSILVECDSQQFHERTEPERRYEKRRDRFLTSAGYRVLHFTGSEIVQNPWLVAAEILEAVYIGDQSKQELIDGLGNYLD